MQKSYQTWEDVPLGKMVVADTLQRLIKLVDNGEASAAMTASGNHIDGGRDAGIEPEARMFAPFRSIEV